MTNDLEKQFFDTFGIEPYDRYIHCDEEGYCKLTLPCACCDKGRDVQKYPAITDRILLELICIESVENPYRGWGGNENAEELKESVLSTFIEGYTYDIYWDSEQIKHQVQALFEEKN